MRAIAQLFYFLGSIPGLSFLNRIGSNLSRIGTFSDRAVATKRSLSQARNKNKQEEESEKN